MSLRLSRRDLLKIGGLGLATSLLGQKADAAALFGRMFAVPPRDTTYFTPNDKFYVVNYSDSPFSLSRDVRIDQWRLSITGAVKLPMALSYGDKNVKWITQLEVYEGDYKGYWQRKGWTDDGTIKLTSRIDSPGHYQILRGKEHLFKGIAFGGPETIKKVEISFDSGRTWKDAPFELPLSPYTWVIWYYNWAPPKAGSYQVAVRAIDAKGLVQTAEIVRPSPAGASGLHTIVTVVDRL